MGKEGEESEKKERFYQYCVHVWGDGDKNIDHYVWASESQIRNAMTLLDKKTNNLDNPNTRAEKLDGKIGSLKIFSYNKNSANCAAEELQLPIPFDPELIAESMYIYKIRKPGISDDKLKCNYITIPKSRMNAVFGQYKHLRKASIRLSVGCGIRGVTDGPFVYVGFEMSNCNSLEIIADEEHEFRIALKRLGLPAIT
jgi:hypothetical protein